MSNSLPKYKEEKCQSWVKIEIRETEEELKAFLRKEKDATRHEKLQVLYWLKTQSVETTYPDSAPPSPQNPLPPEQLSQGQADSLAQEIPDW